jgi:gamma-glutamylaminecyclotransferase
MIKEKVFVYGTLKRGGSNFNSRLSGKDTVFISQGITRKKFNMRAQGYPFVDSRFTNQYDANIKGELFEVTFDTLRGPLDGLEGHPNFFKRKRTLISLEDGTQQYAWMYFLNHGGETGHAVPSGDYSVYLEEVKKQY